MVACVECGQQTRRRPYARNPDRCISCSVSAAIAYDLAVRQPGSPEHAQAVANGRKGGRPRKYPVPDGQLTLPGL